METVTKVDLRDLFELSAEHRQLLERAQMYDWWYDRCASFDEMFSLSEFKSKYDAGDIGNFVYYRPLDIVFSTLRPADHADFMSGIYSLHHLKRGILPIVLDFDEYEEERLSRYMNRLFCSNWDGQDNFLIEGLGAYQSSCNRSVSYHRNYQLTAQEKIVFAALEHEVFNWGMSDDNN